MNKSGITITVQVEIFLNEKFRAISTKDGPFYCECVRLPALPNAATLVSQVVTADITNWVFSETQGWVTTGGKRGGGEGVEGGRSKSPCPTTSSGYSPASSIIAETRTLWMSRYNATRLRIRGSRCSHPSTASTAPPPNSSNLDLHQNFAKI